MSYYYHLKACSRHTHITVVINFTPNYWVSMIVTSEMITKVTLSPVFLCTVIFTSGGKNEHIQHYVISFLFKNPCIFEIYKNVPICSTILFVCTNKWMELKYTIIYTCSKLQISFPQGFYNLLVCDIIILLL